MLSANEFTISQEEDLYYGLITIYGKGNDILILPYIIRHLLCFTDLFDIFYQITVFDGFLILHGFRSSLHFFLQILDDRLIFAI